MNQFPLLGAAVEKWVGFPLSSPVQGQKLDCDDPCGSHPTQDTP